MGGGSGGGIGDIGRVGAGPEVSQDLWWIQLDEGGEFHSGSSEDNLLVYPDSTFSNSNQSPLLDTVSNFFLGAPAYARVNLPPRETSSLEASFIPSEVESPNPTLILEKQNQALEEWMADSTWADELIKIFDAEVAHHQIRWQGEYKQRAYRGFKQIWDETGSQGFADKYFERKDRVIARQEQLTADRLEAQRAWDQLNTSSQDRGDAIYFDLLTPIQKVGHHLRPSQIPTERFRNLLTEFRQENFQVDQSWSNLPVIRPQNEGIHLAWSPDYSSSEINHDSHEAWLIQSEYAFTVSYAGQETHYPPGDYIFQDGIPVLRHSQEGFDLEAYGQRRADIIQAWSEEAASVDEYMFALADSLAVVLRAGEEGDKTVFVDTMIALVGMEEMGFTRRVHALSTQDYILGRLEKVDPEAVKLIEFNIRGGEVEGEKDFWEYIKGEYPQRVQSPVMQAGMGDGILDFFRGGYYWLSDHGYLDGDVSDENNYFVESYWKDLILLGVGFGMAGLTSKGIYYGLLRVFPRLGAKKLFSNFLVGVLGPSALGPGFHGLTVGAWNKVTRGEFDTEYDSARYYEMSKFLFWGSLVAGPCRVIGRGLGSFAESTLVGNTMWNNLFQKGGMILGDLSAWTGVTMYFHDLDIGTALFQTAGFMGGNAAFGRLAPDLGGKLLDNAINKQLHEINISEGHLTPEQFAQRVNEAPSTSTRNVRIGIVKFVGNLLLQTVPSYLLSENPGISVSKTIRRNLERWLGVGFKMPSSWKEVLDLPQVKKVLDTPQAKKVLDLPLAKKVLPKAKSVVDYFLGDAQRITTAATYRVQHYLADALAAAGARFVMIGRTSEIITEALNRTKSREDIYVIQAGNHATFLDVILARAIVGYVTILSKLQKGWQRLIPWVADSPLIDRTKPDEAMQIQKAAIERDAGNGAIQVTYPGGTRTPAPTFAIGPYKVVLKGVEFTTKDGKVELRVPKIILLSTTGSHTIMTSATGRQFILSLPKALRRWIAVEATVIDPLEVLDLDGPIEVFGVDGSPIKGAEKALTDAAIRLRDYCENKFYEGEGRRLRTLLEIHPETFQAAIAPFVEVLVAMRSGKFNERELRALAALNAGSSGDPMNYIRQVVEPIVREYPGLLSNHPRAKLGPSFIESVIGRKLEKAQREFDKLSKAAGRARSRFWIKPGEVAPFNDYLEARKKVKTLEAEASRNPSPEVATHLEAARAKAKRLMGPSVRRHAARAAEKVALVEEALVLLSDARFQEAYNVLSNESVSQSGGN